VTTEATPEGTTDMTETTTKPTTTETPARPKRRGRPRTVHVDQGEQGINLPPPAPAPAKPKRQKRETPEDAIRVIPVRGKTTADDEKGDYVIAMGVSTPWSDQKPGALRLVRGVKATLKRKLDFRHGKLGVWLGQYITVKAEPGKRYSVWEVQPPS
jgi:hypothetical protein